MFAGFKEEVVSPVETTEIVNGKSDNRGVFQPGKSCALHVLEVTLVASNEFVTSLLAVNPRVSSHS